MGTCGTTYTHISWIVLYTACTHDNKSKNLYESNNQQSKWVLSNNMLIILTNKPNKIPTKSVVNSQEWIKNN